MNNLIIAQTEIKIKDGLYCLNDLHKASQLPKHKTPNKWLGNQSTKEVVQELSRPQNRGAVLEVANGGNDHGTYACKELVYSYAMWLSPAFHIAVVQAYDKLVTQPIAPALPNFNDPVEAARAWANEKEQTILANAVIEQQTVKIEAAKPAVEFVDSYNKSEGTKGFRQVCKLLKVKENVFRDWLIDKKVMYRLGGKLTGCSVHCAAGRFEMKTGVNEYNGESYVHTKFTPKGVTWIAGLWASHNMKQQLALTADK